MPRAMAARLSACRALLLATLVAGCAALASSGHDGLLHRLADDLAAERGRGKPCHDTSHRKSTLKLIKETAFAGIFRDLKNSTKFEASGMARVRGEFYVVFDNAMSLGHLDDRFQFRDPHNVLIGDWEPESQFEGIAYVPENATFLLLHEALEHEGRAPTYKPFIREVKIQSDMGGYDTLSVCEVDYEFDEENKGFEGIQYIHTENGVPYLMGLCEGNHCAGGSKGRDFGNGRIVVSRLQWKDDKCVWEPEKTIKVPEGAYFQDYSAFSYNYETQKLAIVSQEDAAIWIGDFDGDAAEFKSEEGVVFHLPRDNHCEMIYCNAEGIQWVDNYRIAIASDKAKTKQPYWCDAKDQMIHLFAMPQAWDPYSPADELARGLQREAAQEAAAARGEL